MKNLIFTVALSAALVPTAASDVSGPKKIPVQKPEQTLELGPITVPLNEAVPVKFPDAIAGVSLGSPYVANVVVHDKHLMFITGRAYGMTSLHVVDEKGNVIATTTVNVVGVNETRLVVNKGGSDYSMQCTPKCKAAPDIGDNTDYVTTITEQATILSKED